MRISNWTQFANIYTDPQNPENGPFMEGAYLAHAVYGYFQNGGIARLDHPGRERRGHAAAAQAALPAATDKGVEALRAVALDRRDRARSSVEVTEEPRPGGQGRASRPTSWS